MSFKSSFGGLEDTRGFWLGFGILIMICIWSLVFDATMTKIMALCLDFEGAKKIHVLLVLNWCFGRRCWLLTGDLHLDLNLEIVTGLWYNNDLNFGSLSWFWKCKEHPCPLGPHLELLRMLEVPDWGLASWSRFGYGHWSLIYPWSKFWLTILILKAKWASMSFQSWFGDFEDAGGSWLWFGILILIWIWWLVFDTSELGILSPYLNF